MVGEVYRQAVADPPVVESVPEQAGETLGSPLRLGVVLLAAGSGRRFGGTKQLASLDGRPVLQHVVDTVASVRPAVIVAVVGHEADRVADAIDWRGATVVRNPRYADGLAGSLRVGMSAIADVRPPIDGAFVCLGDQPRVRASVLRTLAGAVASSERSIVAPAYAAEPAGALNPVLLLRSAWPLLDDLAGDRGMGPLIRARPELVVRVPVEGDNPDMDTVTDLRRLQGS
jgi:CTP:molybdopterin cytidylyltransferase MocA